MRSVKLLLFIISRISILSNFGLGRGPTYRFLRFGLGHTTRVRARCSESVNIRMKRPTHCATLRLSPDLAEAIESRAFEQCVSQSDWIRRAIRRALVQEYENEIRVAGERSATSGTR